MVIVGCCGGNPWTWRCGDARLLVARGFSGTRQCNAVCGCPLFLLLALGRARVRQSVGVGERTRAGSFGRCVDRLFVVSSSRAGPRRKSGFSELWKTPCTPTPFPSLQVNWIDRFDSIRSVHACWGRTTRSSYRAGASSSGCSNSSCGTTSAC